MTNKIQWNKKIVWKSILYFKNIKYNKKPLSTLFGGKKMYGKPFGIKTHRDKGFSTMQKMVNFRIDFKEEQTWLQLCNGEIDEKVKHLYRSKKCEK
jgi:hypothetical protein